MRLWNDPPKKLSATILKFLCEVRQAKIFPTVDSLTQTNQQVVKSATNSLKKIFIGKILIICKLVQQESSYAIPLLQCPCEELFVKEIEKDSKSVIGIKDFDVTNYSTGNELCFECLDKNHCQHKSLEFNDYTFLHFHAVFNCQPTWKRS